MKTTFIRLQTNDNLELEGLLFEPAAPAKSIVIHVHGSAGNFYENNFIDNFAWGLVKNEIAFLTFNNRGAEYVRDSAPGMLGELFEECVLDISSAINYVQKRGFTDIILQGHSLGCNKVIWYALEQSFGGRIILLAPCDLARDRGPGHSELVKNARKLLADGKDDQKLPNFWGKWEISAQTLVHTWGEDVNADMFRYRNWECVPAMAKLRNNILVAIGTADGSILPKKPTDCAEYLKKSFANAKLCVHLIDDADHGYHGKEQILVENVTKWLC